LAWIRQLFDIEDRAAEWSVEERCAFRQAEAVPILDRMEVWLQERLAKGEEDLDALLPDRWKASHPEAVRTYRQHEREAKAGAKRERRRRRRTLERANAGLTP